MAQGRDVNNDADLGVRHGGFMFLAFILSEPGSFDPQL